MITLIPLPRDAALSVIWRVSDPVPVLERPVRAPRPAGIVDYFERHIELCTLLRAIPNTGTQELDYDQWRNVVFAIHHETGGSDDGLQLAHELSARASKYAPGFLDERVWPHIRSDRGDVVGLGTLKRIAAGFGWQELPPSADVFDDVSAGDDRPPLPAARSASTETLRLVLAARGLLDAQPVPQDDRMAWDGTQMHSTRVNGHDHGPGVANEPHALTTAGPRAPGFVSATALNGSPPPAPVKRRGIPEAQHLCTDQANANRLVNAFGRQVFVAAGRWHVWDGRRWLADEADVYRYGCRLSGLIRDEAVALKARASVLDAAEQKKAAGIADALMKWAVKSEMKGCIEAAIGLARKMLTVDADLLDRDPFALNVLNGIVDLRTGVLRLHNPDEMLTKLVPVAYVPEARCPTWDRVLREITREEVGSAPVASFLARWFGYCLTGAVIEQVFVVHWGTGSNGKSTVLGLMAETLGDYAGTAAPGLMAASKSDRHPTEIASLMGRRMVTAHESAENVVLREDFIKQATGDDRLEARWMRGDFFGFSPTHKLQLLTNHKPQVKGTDPGIWRRVLLVPYGAAFGTAAQVEAGTHTGLRDLGLMEALRGELEGILAWRVRGAVEWASGGGLAAPAAVRAASDAYRSEQDRVGQFVAECCERGVGAEFMEPLTDAMGGLYPAYVSWCKDGGVFALSKARFTDDVLRVVGAGEVVARLSSVENGRRRKLTYVPGLRLLPE